MKTSFVALAVAVLVGVYFTVVGFSNARQIGEGYRSAQWALQHPDLDPSWCERDSEGLMSSPEELQLAYLRLVTAVTQWPPSIVIRDEALCKALRALGKEPVTRVTRDFFGSEFLPYFRGDALALTHYEQLREAVLTLSKSPNIATLGGFEDRVAEAMLALLPQPGFGFAFYHFADPSGVWRAELPTLTLHLKHEPGLQVVIEDDAGQRWRPVAWDAQVYLVLPPVD